MNRSEIFSVIRENIHTVLENTKGQEISETDSLRELGADSLEIVEIVSRSMKQLKLRLPRSALSEARNLGDLVSLFEAAASKAST